MADPKGNHTKPKPSAVQATSDNNNKTSDYDEYKKSSTKSAIKGVKGFQPGKSGNPKGRPPGSRNKTTMAIEALLEGEFEAITRKCIDMALDGNNAAMKLVMDRIAPIRKTRPVNVKLPPIQTSSDILEAYDCVMQAVTQGEISLEEAEQLVKLLESKRKMIETVVLNERLEKIEEHLGIV